MTGVPFSPSSRQSHHWIKTSCKLSADSEVSKSTKSVYEFLKPSKWVNCRLNALTGFFLLDVNFWKQANELTVGWMLANWGFIVGHTYGLNEVFLSFDERCEIFLFISIQHYWMYSVFFLSSDFFPILFSFLILSLIVDLLFCSVKLLRSWCLKCSWWRGHNYMLRTSWLLFFGTDSHWKCQPYNWGLTSTSFMSMLLSACTVLLQMLLLLLAFCLFLISKRIESSFFNDLLHMFSVV